MPTVVSTLSASQRYTEWTDGPDGKKLEVGSVYVAGHANVADKHVVTPYGVATTVTDEQLARLRRDDMFKRHLDRGHVMILEDIESASRISEAVMGEITADMTAKDKSAPLTPDDYQERTGTTAEIHVDEEAKPATRKGRAK